MLVVLVERARQYMVPAEFARPVFSSLAAIQPLEWSEFGPQGQAHLWPGQGAVRPSPGGRYGVGGRLGEL